MLITILPLSCGMIQENAYIVSADGRDDCFVVDPGDEADKLIRAVGDKRVGAILLTHGHFDHIMATGTLAERYDAPVYAGAADIEMLNDPSINGYANLMGIAKQTWPRIGATPYGDALEICGMAFEVIPTPGHSMGSVCLYLKDAGVIFTGDTLFEAGYGRLDLHGGNLNEMIASLRRLFALPGDVRAYPGHGGATTIGAERARYRL